MSQTILVLGASGMLGNTILRYFSADAGRPVIGTVRSSAAMRLLPQATHSSVRVGVDVEDPDALMELFDSVRPAVVINCVGVVKQLSQANDPLAVIPINALLPHRLARLCALVGARLVHVSTDCVFSGAKGNYREVDPADAKDLYGRSKLLGEVDYPHAITLRTSIIGHELGTSHGLVGWFLAQEGSARGFTRAVFSGLPTVELARIIHDMVIPRPYLHGTYHVSSAPIRKYDLLELIARIYGKCITLIPDAQLIIDRSLDSTRFRQETGYEPPSWEALVQTMHHFG